MLSSSTGTNTSVCTAITLTQEQNYFLLDTIKDEFLEGDQRKVAIVSAKKKSAIQPRKSPAIIPQVLPLQVCPSC